LKLATRLNLSLSLIIILVLSGYGYFHISSRRDVLQQMMEADTRGIGQILRVSLEKISLPREMVYVQELLDSVSEPKRTFGAIFYHANKDIFFRSQSIDEGSQAFEEMIRRAMGKDAPVFQTAVYNRTPVFAYAFPLHDRRGRVIGGVSILQHTRYLEEQIQKTKQDIIVTILLLIVGTVLLIRFLTRRWLTVPMFQLMAGIQNMANGRLDTRLEIQRGEEVSRLARAFNRMASDLQRAQEKTIQEAEARLDLQRNLRRSEKMATLGQLASELAHEMGTPLNIIEGRAELAKRKLGDRETAQKNLDTIILQSRRITRIIRQLLGYVRERKGEPSCLSVETILETTLDLVGDQLEKQKVQVVREFLPNLPEVRGDPDQLQQVFLNLVLNAVQAMPEGGTLRLAAQAQWASREGLGDRKRLYVQVRVEDTGMGMDKEVMDQIFTPFFTTKEGGKGTGLGLTVSQGIIRENDGWIEARSESGKGSCFEIYLPAAESRTVEEKEDCREKQGGGTG
jgi:two-component system, NtrC family, sensor kinase